MKSCNTPRSFLERLKLVADKDVFHVYIHIFTICGIPWTAVKSVPCADESAALFNTMATDPSPCYLHIYMRTGAAEGWNAQQVFLLLQLSVILISAEKNKECETFAKILMVTLIM